MADVFSPEARAHVEEGPELLGLEGLVHTPKVPGGHSDDPFTKAAALLRIAFTVYVIDELGGYIPVAAQVEVLYSIHCRILKDWNVESGGEEMQLDKVTEEILTVILSHLNLADQLWQQPPVDKPVDKELKHIRACVLEANDEKYALMDEFDSRAVDLVLEELTC